MGRPEQSSRPTKLETRPRRITKRKRLTLLRTEYESNPDDGLEPGGTRSYSGKKLASEKKAVQYREPKQTASAAVLKRLENGKADDCD